MKKYICWMGLFLFLVNVVYAASFTDNADGTVTDNESGLIWQKADDNTARNWETALTYCEGLTLGGRTDWRLPSKNELQSIVDYSVYSPAINSTYFPNTKSSNYWSSTTSASYTSYAWYVYFYNGYVDGYYKTNTNYVRCVRGGL
ncbi:DUF1566 domain-containing protein [Deltaproteobacteria bacterium TL4]